MSDKYDIKCPYCDSPADFIDSNRYYSSKMSYGMIYICRPCDAVVGVHGNTAKPLGTLAKPTLRSLRKCCHEILDKMWKRGKMNRYEAYHHLSQIMDMTKDEAHIGLFREQDCIKFLALKSDMRVCFFDK